MDVTSRRASGWYAPAALLPDGWRESVELLVDEQGCFEAVRADVAFSDLPALEGPIVPGMVNVHSHAFQRALVGRTQTVSPSDDFWSWRSAMYRLVDALEPEDVEAVSAWTYAQMVAAGYTSVGEFHYLHRDRNGEAYADLAELSLRVVSAAAAAGIGLTLLPVLYRRSNLNGDPLNGPARRFLLTVDQYADLVDRIAATDDVAVGLAPHSVRAVSAEDIEALLSLRSDDQVLHMHVAEQPREVDDCIRTTGLRPAQWMIEHVGHRDRVTAIHATHTTAQERLQMARDGTGVGLCPTTEADLGDGVFPLDHWLSLDGHLAIGSDSQVSIDPIEELRLLVYTARLTSLRRGALPLRPDRPLGAQLWQQCAEGGARATGLPVGRIEPGARADFLVLDTRSPESAGLDPDQMLDAFVMSGTSAGIARTVVAGRTVAERGIHRSAPKLALAARTAMERVAHRMSG